MKVGVLLLSSLTFAACGFEGQDIEDPSAGQATARATLSGTIAEADRFSRRVVALLPPATIDGRRPCLEERELMSKYVGPTGPFHFLLSDVEPGSYQLAVAHFRVMSSGGLLSAEIALRNIGVDGTKQDFGELGLPPALQITRSERDSRASWTVPPGFETAVYQVGLSGGCAEGTPVAFSDLSFKAPGVFKIVNTNRTTNQISIGTVSLR